MLFVLAEARVGQIREAGEFGLEGEFHRAGGSMTLFGDDDVGGGFHLFEKGFPLGIFRIGNIARVLFCFLYTSEAVDDLLWGGFGCCLFI